MWRATCTPALAIAAALTSQQVTVTLRDAGAKAVIAGKSIALNAQAVGRLRKTIRLSKWRVIRALKERGGMDE